MAKIIQFHNSINRKREKAIQAYEESVFDIAVPLLYDIIASKEGTDEDSLLLARIYSEMNQFDFSNRIYIGILADKQNVEAVNGLIANLLCQGLFKEARYYNDLYNINFDFSNYLTIQTDDGQVLFGDDDDDEDAIDLAVEKRMQFKLVVNKKTKDGENLVSKKEISPEMTLGDFLGLASSDFTNVNFSELMEKLMDFEGDQSNECTYDNKPSNNGFKQVYPLSNEECENLIKYAIELYSVGKPDEALKKLQLINHKNDKYFYIAEKNKIMCYLSLNRIASMKASIDLALKYFPNDYSLKCYNYIALNLLEDKSEAEKAFKEVIDNRPTTTVEYVVKLDACRLNMYHEGVLECVENILKEVSYQPNLLILKGKAQFNAGHVKAAKASFLETLYLYPENYEAKFLIEKINEDNAVMGYGELDLVLKRNALLRNIKLLSQHNNDFLNYLNNDETAFVDLEYLLNNESNQNIYYLLELLSRNYIDKTDKLFKKLLLNSTNNKLVKKLLLTYYLIAAKPNKINVTDGYKLIKLNIPSHRWESEFCDKTVEAVYMAMADLILNKNNPKKLVNSLTLRLMRLNEYFQAPKNLEIVAAFSENVDVVAMKKAFYDLTLNSVKTNLPMSIEDENYYKYIKYLKNIEEDYEI